MSFVNVGFGNYINKERIVSIVTPSSAPIKRLRDTLEKEGKVIDVTQGRKTRALIIMDSGHIILSGIAVSTLAERVNE